MKITTIQFCSGFFSVFRKAALCAAIFVAQLSPGYAEDIVGKSIRIINQVSGSIGNRDLHSRDPVFRSEIIEAGSQSHGEILLNDSSKVLIGEKSSIRLDDFVVGGTGFDNGSIHVAKGAFRFITGNSKKGAFTVNTPLSSIGVRGTIFDVYVTETGVTKVILFRGEVEVCSRVNCIIANKACDIVEVNSNRAVKAPYLRSGAISKENEDYELTVLQGRFRAAWRAPTVKCDFRAAFDPDLPRKKYLKNPTPDEPGRDPQNNNPCASLQEPILENGTLLAGISGEVLAVVAPTPPGSTTFNPCS